MYLNVELANYVIRKSRMNHVISLITSSTTDPRDLQIKSCQPIRDLQLINYVDTKTCIDVITEQGSILQLVWSPWCLKMSFCDQTFVIGCQIGEQVKKLLEMLFLCHLVSRFELSRVHDKVKDKISLFTVNLVHYFKRRSDFVLNRDHFHNN